MTEINKFRAKLDAIMMQENDTTKLDTQKELNQAKSIFEKKGKKMDTETYDLFKSTIAEGSKLVNAQNAQNEALTKAPAPERRTTINVNQNDGNIINAPIDINGSVSIGNVNQGESSSQVGGINQQTVIGNNINIGNPEDHAGRNKRADNTDGADQQQQPVKQQPVKQTPVDGGDNGKTPVDGGDNGKTPVKKQPVKRTPIDGGEVRKDPVNGGDNRITPVRADATRNGNAANVEGEKPVDPRKLIDPKKCKYHVGSIDLRGENLITIKNAAIGRLESIAAFDDKFRAAVNNCKSAEEIVALCLKNDVDIELITE